jgi:hypothetical protein
MHVEDVYRRARKLCAEHPSRTECLGEMPADGMTVEVEALQERDAGDGEPHRATDWWQPVEARVDVTRSELALQRLCCPLVPHHGRPQRAFVQEEGSEPLRHPRAKRSRPRPFATIP